MGIYARLSVVRSLCFACSAALGLIFSNQSHAGTPKLFFYPPPWTFPDGSVISSPLTVAVDQATTLFPQISEMAGVAVIVNWATICPEEKKCNFDLIDQIISYWSKRGKQVVLAVATVGYPTRSFAASGPVFQSATPDWVLDKVRTYKVNVSTLGEIKGIRHQETRFPDYSDPRFIAYVDGLVSKLSKYDGNPTVAQIRVSAGLLTEDNPNPVGALKYQMPGFTNADWIGYCRRVLAIFQSHFTRSELEFDLGVVGWIAATGSDSDRKLAEAFIGELISKKVFLAFDGWNDSSVAELQANKRDGVSYNLRVLRRAKSHGSHVGLEAIGPITSSDMQDIDELERAVSIVKPDRIVFFSDVPAFLKEEREGPSDSTKTAMDFLRVQPKADATRPHIKPLLRRLTK